jgi:hypothetical protein
MHHNKITNMRYTFLYLFICYLTNIIPSIEYAQMKENQIISKAFFINACTYLFYYFYLIQILGLYTHAREAAGGGGGSTTTKKIFHIRVDLETSFIQSVKWRAAVVLQCTNNARQQAPLQLATHHHPL